MEQGTSCFPLVGRCSGIAFTISILACTPFLVKHEVFILVSLKRYGNEMHSTGGGQEGGRGAAWSSEAEDLQRLLSHFI